MIELIQQWIWNIGGFLFSITLILLILTLMYSWIINRLSGWFKKENRRNLIYWIRNKDKINKIIEEQKYNKGKINV